MILNRYERTIAKRYLRRDGTTVWAQAYVTRLVDADGRPSFSGMVRPVLPSLCLPPRPVPVPQARYDRARLMDAPPPGGLPN